MVKNLFRLHVFFVYLFALPSIADDYKFREKPGPEDEILGLQLHRELDGNNKGHRSFENVLMRGFATIGPKSSIQNTTFNHSKTLYREGEVRFTGATLTGNQFGREVNDIPERGEVTVWGNIDFRGADLSRSRFGAVLFRNTSFAGAKLDEVSFKFSKFREADFRSTDLSRAELLTEPREIRGIYNDQTRLPEDFLLDHDYFETARTLIYRDAPKQRLPGERDSRKGLQHRVDIDLFFLEEAFQKDRGKSEFEALIAPIKNELQSKAHQKGLDPNRDLDLAKIILIDPHYLTPPPARGPRKTSVFDSVRAALLNLEEMKNAQLKWMGAKKETLPDEYKRIVFEVLLRNKFGLIRIPPEEDPYRDFSPEELHQAIREITSREDFLAEVKTLYDDRANRNPPSEKKAKEEKERYDEILFRYLESYRNQTLPQESGCIPSLPSGIRTAMESLKIPVPKNCTTAQSPRANDRRSPLKPGLPGSTGEAPTGPSKAGTAL